MGKRSRFGRVVMSLCLALFLAPPAAAQYMRITTDNPADNTRMRATGTTILTITLDTNHDRNGSLQTCNSHSALSCGAPSSAEPLDMFSYTVALRAVGGTVSWGTFAAADPNYTDVSAQIQNSTEIEINQSRPPGTLTPPGLATIGTVPVTTVTGSPAIQLQIGPGTLNPGGFGNGFGTSCGGSAFSHTYVLGRAEDPCGNQTGLPGDWFDWDGAASACLGCQTQPQIDAPATALAHEGSLFSISATATDPDAGAILTLTVSGQPPDLPGPNVTGPSPVIANLTGTPGFDDAGTYNVIWNVNDGTGAPNASNSATTVLTIANTNRPPSFLNLVEAMNVCQGGTADQSLSATDPDAEALTFSKLSGPSFMTVTTTSPTTGNIHLTPAANATPGSTSASVRVTDPFGATSDRSFPITVLICDRSPTLNQPANMLVAAGATADQVITGSDPDGAALTFSKVSGPVWMMVTTTTPTSGNIHLAPPLGTSGSFLGTVRASNGVLVNDKNFQITVPGVNRCPVAQPGGPYAGLVNASILFDGSASSDPDGNPLGYAWDFDASDGITVDATGAVAGHAYAMTGAFTVTLTVTDNGSGVPAEICSQSATTTATITTVCPATVFNGYDTIRLGSGKPFWFAYVQPATACYANSDVAISSFVMKYAGRQISASGKTSVGGDKSGDGIAEIKINFSKDDLRALFSGTGLPNGHSDVTVTLEADLASGGKLGGTTHLDVVNNGNFSAAEIAPNPLNPQAILTFTTSRPGAVRIDLFSIQGRLVRRLVDESALAAGIHDVTIDGRGSRGEKLPSGVYYIRGASSEGEFKHLITILK